jgi:hypothetical protein
MQNAVALASSEKAKQLAAATADDQLEGGKRRAEADAQSDDRFVPVRRP